MQKIKKLSQEVINKIAAGEVIEKPASVIKELIDNSIDADSTKIEITIEDGGKKLISVEDNGTGISKEDLPNAFEAHATSKIKDFEDLNEVLTMGFRGEALSTIVSVSNVKVISKIKESEFGYKLEFEGIKLKEIAESPSKNGTKIIVENLFDNVPARLKYLRTTETEYRSIINILLPYFIYYPNIHFVFKKDGKVIYNLPVEESNNGKLSKKRISKVIKSDFINDLIEIFYSGNGIEIGGYVAKPNYHSPRVQVNYCFINGRPVNDRGVFKSIMQGFGSYIPHGDRIPYIVSINIPTSMVDINVHPRKEEVRFTNPYRIYNAIEQAINDALTKNITFESNYYNEVNNNDEKVENAYSRLRGFSEAKTYNDYERDSDFKSNFKDSGGLSKKERIKSSIEFSKTLFDKSEFGNESIDPSVKADLEPKAFYQLFNKYILVEFSDQIWIIDQHAAAERITFEKLLKSDKNKPDVQKYLIPKEINITETTRSFLQENIKEFNKLGFEFEINEDKALISEVPVEFENTDFQEMFDQILLDDLSNYESEKSFEKIKKDILATMACHNSIRSNQSMETEELKSIFIMLSECENPYSCPHGRPIVWKMTINEIDSNFDRTY